MVRGTKAALGWLVVTLVAGCSAIEPGTGPGSPIEVAASCG